MTDCCGKASTVTRCGTLVVVGVCRRPIGHCGPHGSDPLAPGEVITVNGLDGISSGAPVIITIKPTRKTWTMRRWMNMVRRYLTSDKVAEK